MNRQQGSNPSGTGYGRNDNMRTQFSQVGQGIGTGLPAPGGFGNNPNVPGRPFQMQIPPGGVGTGPMILQQQTNIQSQPQNQFNRIQTNYPQQTNLSFQQAQFQDLYQQQQPQLQMQYADPTIGQAYFNSGGTTGVTPYQPINQFAPLTTNSRGMLVSGTNNPFYGKGDDFYGRAAGPYTQRGSSSGSISSRRPVDEDEYKQQIILGIKLAAGMPVGGYAGMGIRSSFGFDILYNTQHIFIQPSESDFADLFNTPNLVGKFDILDTSGDRIYYATDVLGKGGNKCCSGSGSFAISIMSYDGNEVLSVTGNTRTFVMKYILGSPLLDKKRILGDVDEDDRCCSTVTNYAIKDSVGNLCFRVIREPENPNPTEYEVFGNDMVKIGRMSKIWPGLPRRDQKLAHNYGISFPLDMEVKEKAMMMGAAVGVYMKYYGDRKRDRRIAQKAWCCGIFVVLLLAFIIVGIIYVLIRTARVR